MRTTKKPRVLLSVLIGDCLISRFKLFQVCQECTWTLSLFPVCVSQSLFNKTASIKPTKTSSPLPPSPGLICPLVKAMRFHGNWGRRDSYVWQGARWLGAEAVCCCSEEEDKAETVVNHPRSFNVFQAWKAWKGVQGFSRWISWRCWKHISEFQTWILQYLPRQMCTHTHTHLNSALKLKIVMLLQTLWLPWQLSPVPAVVTHTHTLLPPAGSPSS